MMLFDLPDLARPAPDTDDETLVSALRALATREREARADFIIHLAEFDRRRLYLPAGFPSLFAWLIDHLRFSKASAYRRVTAARLCQGMPAVAAYLRDGRLSLVKLCLLKDLLEPESHLALLEQAASMTETEVEELAAVLDPSRQAPRDSIRPLQPAPSGPPPSLDLFARPGRAADVHADGPVAERTPSGERVVAGFMVEPARARAPAKAAPVRHVVKMTVGPEFLALLEQVRAELSHSHPTASLETLLAECMRVALAVRRKRSRAQTNRPRRPKTAVPARSGSRYIPAEVRRQVWERDQGRCTFVSAEGRRCEATHRLELHHEIPVGRCGPATVANVRVMCKLHNDLLARRDYSDEHMDQFTRAPSAGDRPARRRRAEEG